MRVGLLLVNFGEPAAATPEQVESFLHRIFLRNSSLESLDRTAAEDRSRQLAVARAPGLLAEYRQIGGSPLNAQADAQAEAVNDELRSRGSDVRTWSAFQFTPPFVAEAVRNACADGVELLVGLPVYPLCGRSTTLAALDDIEQALDESGGNVPFIALAGWHRHPDYVRLRVDNIRGFVESRGLDLCDADTLLYFSAHGTPDTTSIDGNRYDRYVAEHCADIARELGAPNYAVGFQNHSGRNIEWTQPDNEVRIREATERHLVVEPISFVHEQSETLAELDHELRGFAESQGKAFHRVPVAHDDARLPRVLADLVESAITAFEAGQPPELSICRCRAAKGTWCTNGNRDLPPSPFLRAG